MIKKNILLIIMLALILTSCKEYVENIEVTTPDNKGVTFERKDVGQTADTTKTTLQSEPQTTTTAESTSSSSEEKTTKALSEKATTSTDNTTTTQSTTTTTKTSETTSSVTLQPFSTTSVEETTQKVLTSDSDADLDLTMMSQTMAYSALYNMMINPKGYVGDSIKISGTALSDYYEKTGQTYYFVVIVDEAACCQQGLEYRLSSGSYPKDETVITVEGIFGGYEEDGQIYYRLNDAVIE